MIDTKKNVLLAGNGIVSLQDEKAILEDMGYSVIMADSSQKAQAIVDAEIGLDLAFFVSDIGVIHSLKGIPVFFLCDPSLEPPKGYLSINRGSDKSVFASVIKEALYSRETGKLPTDRMGLFEALVEQIDDIVVVKDLKLKVVAANQALVKAIGKSSISEIVGKSDDEIFCIPADKEPVKSYMADERHAQTLSQGEYILKEEPLICPGGEVRILLTKKYPIYDEKGRLAGTGNISRDITERKTMEERVQHLLDEKDLILREAHHRIKNNMNTMMSLLSLHAWSLRDPDAVMALEDAKNRLGAMALLYDRLYRSGRVESASVREYLPSLVEEIVETFPLASNLSTSVEVDDVVLPAGTLSSLGILVNEIVTNSMKYAFKGRSSGKIGLSVKRRGSNIEMELCDDGPGFPEDFPYDDLENSSGFGMKLVAMLVRQLKGSVSMTNEAGAKVVIRFPIEG